MKKLKNILILLINVIFISEVNAASNPYNQTSSYGTNCTWYAWKMAKEKAGVSLPGWGNAKDWYKDAKADGYSVGTKAASNSIVVWGTWTSYGHVGYVEKVEGDTIFAWDSTGPCIDEEDQEYIECMANGVSEESDRICRANAKKTYCQYSITDENYPITGFIYLNETPKKVTSSSSNNTSTTKKENTQTQVTISKSNNNYLSNLEISNISFAFDKDITEYELTIENEISKITITATPEDSTATLTGVGEYDLEVGTNEIKIIVTAEDNTTKEYVLNITRQEEIKTTIEEETISQKEEVTIVKKGNDKLVIIVTVIVIVAILTIIVFILKKQKKK